MAGMVIAIAGVATAFLANVYRFAGSFSWSQMEKTNSKADSAGRNHHRSHRRGDSLRSQFSCDTDGLSSDWDRPVFPSPLLVPSVARSVDERAIGYGLLLGALGGAIGGAFSCKRYAPASRQK